MATENIRLMGKKQGFVMAILMVTAVLLSVTLAEFVNTVSIKEESIVETDSHYIRLDFTKVSSVRVTKQRLQILEYAWKYFDDNEFGEVVAIPSIAPLEVSITTPVTLFWAPWFILAASITASSSL